MAHFPVPLQTASSTNSGTSNVVAIPNGSNVAGRRVVIYFSLVDPASGENPTAPGWTQLRRRSSGTTQDRDVLLAVFYRDLTGSEGFPSTGATITITTSVTENSASVAELYEVGDFNPGIAPFVSSGTSAPRGTSDTPDPDSLNTGTSRHYGWRAIACRNQGGTSGFDSNPANYTNPLDASSGGTSSHTMIRVTRRGLVAQTENPGPYVINSDNCGWVAFTAAMAPGGEPSSGTLTQETPFPVISMQGVGVTPPIDAELHASFPALVSSADGLTRDLGAFHEDCPDCLDVKVQIALGADPSAPPGSWSWTTLPTISDDDEETYLLDQEISMSRGRSDWASAASPAQASFRIWNPSGDLAPSCNSQVRRDMPVRIVALDAEGSGAVRFCGLATAISQEWPEGDLASPDFPGACVITIEASGVLERVSRFDPLPSTLRGFITKSAVGNDWSYWSMETGVEDDVGQLLQSEQLQSGGAILVGTDGTSLGEPLGMLPGTAASWNKNHGSEQWVGDPITGVMITNGPLGGSTTFTASAFVFLSEHMIEASSASIVDFLLLVQMHNGTGSHWGGLTGGAIGIFIQSKILRLQDAGGTSNIITNPPPGWYLLELVALSATDVRGRARYVPTGAVSGATRTWSTRGSGSSLAMYTIGNFATWDERIGSSWAHWLLRPGETGESFGANLMPFARGHVGEQPWERAERLSEELGVPIETCPDTTINQPMGPQTAYKTPIEILEEAQAVGVGFLGESRGCVQGLKLCTAGAIHGQTPKMVLDARQNDITVPLRAVLDTQGYANQVTATNMITETSRMVPAGEVQPRFPLPVTLNVANSNQLQGQALWRLRLSSSEAPRVAELTIDLFEARDLRPAALMLSETDLISVVNLPPQWCGGELLLIVQGINESLGPHSWTMTFNCTSGDPWVHQSLPL